MPTRVQLLLSLDGPQRAAANSALGTLDYPVAGTRSGCHLIETNLGRAPFSSWLVTDGGRVAGVFALAPTPRPGFHREASIYLVPEARGRGLFGGLYTRAGHAAHRSGLRVVSSVAACNQRSVAAHRKVFGHQPSAVPGIPDPDELFVLFDLRTLPRV